ncbi:MAG: FAD-binding oxidoreductase, partial [Natronospirillum sp.]
LTEQEEDTGFLLSCQARARSDMELHYAYPLSLLRKTETTVTAVVQAIETMAMNVVRVQVQPEQPLDFLPGQYVNIKIPGADRERSFSFVNAPNEPGLYEFYIRILPDGLMSNYLRDQVQVGDTLRLRGPFGQFFLRKPRSSEILMLAGGTGVGPMLSMIEHMAKHYVEKPQVTLLYGANQCTELVDLSALVPYRDWVTVRTIAVEGDPGSDAVKGFVTDLIRADDIQDKALLDAYLCGPPPMIEASRTALERLGVTPERIFAEKFLPAA